MRETNNFFRFGVGLAAPDLRGFQKTSMHIRTRKTKNSGWTLTLKNIRNLDTSTDGFHNIFATVVSHRSKLDENDEFVFNLRYTPIPRTNYNGTISRHCFILLNQRFHFGCYMCNSLSLTAIVMRLHSIIK